MRKLFFLFAAILLASTTLLAEKIDGVKYIDADGVEQTANGVNVITDATEQVTWSAGWYVVTGTDVQTGSLTCSGAVNLILADGAKLTATGAKNQAGIQVSGEGNSLTIYAQSTGDQMGQLIATGGDYGAGIGGGADGSGHDITINGGNVTANGGYFSAGIGGGDGGDGFRITINGGTVTANGHIGGAGIGGGQYKTVHRDPIHSEDGSLIFPPDTIVGGKCYEITILAGTVTAKGGNFAAGIGGGRGGDGEYIRIDGGIVTANSTINGAGIGGGQAKTIEVWETIGDNPDVSKKNITFGNGRNIFINGGIVTATGEGYGAGIGGGGAGIDGGGAGIDGGGAGIDGGGGEGRGISITGGTITATGGIAGAAGIGGSNGGEGSYITIDGGTVTATGGNASAGIGGGRQGSASYINVAAELILKADNINPPTKVIAGNRTAATDIASDLAGKQYVTITILDLALYRAAAIDEIDDAIEGITDETILAIATAAKTNIGVATTAGSIDAIKEKALADLELAIYKAEAIDEIDDAIEGITDETILAVANTAKTNIGAATTEADIDAIKEKALADLEYALGFYNSGIEKGKAAAKAEALGEMATPCDGCNAVEVKKGTTVVTLYTPDEVKFIKTEAAE